MTQLIDAGEDFATLRTAMTRARHTIRTIGWAIDSRLQLVPGGPPDGFPPAGLADFLCALAVQNRQPRVTFCRGFCNAVRVSEWLPAYEMMARKSAHSLPPARTP
jgi:hypothetical protein